LRAQNEVSKTKYQLSRFINDEIRTTVPFYTIKTCDQEVIIQEAKKRALQQLKAFHRAFDKVDSLSANSEEEKFKA